MNRKLTLSRCVAVSVFFCFSLLVKAQPYPTDSYELTTGGMGWGGNQGPYPESIGMCKILKVWKGDEIEIDMEADPQLQDVVIISESAFSNCQHLTTIKVASSVKFICAKAFKGCTSLKNVELPENLYWIENSLFEGCTSLETINLPHLRYQKICAKAFLSCTSLKTIQIPSDVYEIGSGAFEKCQSLQSVILPESLKTISDDCFGECSNLKTVQIPSGVVSIGNSAFGRCTWLESVTFGNSLTTIGWQAFYDCKQLTDIILPNSLQTIGFNAFCGCGLTTVSIPSGVKKIGEFAFNDNPLTEMRAYPIQPPTGWPEYFAVPDMYTSGTCKLLVPEESVELYKTTYPWSKFKSVWILPDAGCDLSDLPTNNAYYASTAFLCDRGVLSGSKVDGKTAVDDPLKRAHLAKIAFRGLYLTNGGNVPTAVPSDNYPTVYTDLTDKSTYYYQAARALMYLEYGDGVAPFDRNRLAFEPEGNIARVHTLKVLMEAFNIQPDLESTNNPFPADADVATLAKSNPRLMGYIRRAAALGIITTANSTFRPYADCKRGEAFVMLARIMQKIEAKKIAAPQPQESDYFEPLNTTLKTIALGAGLQMGNFQHYTKTSFALSGVVPLTFAHTYNSYNTTLPSVFFGDKSKTEKDDSYLPLGDGWSHNYHSFVTVVGEYSSGNTDNGLRVIVHWGGGGIDVYKSEGGKLVPESMGIYDEMTYTGGDELTIKSKSQITYRFTKQGGTGAAVLYLTSVTDRNDNTLTINYENGQNGSKRISSVSDGHRSLRFSYLSGTDLLSSVKDPLNRSVKFNYFDNKQTGRKQLSSFTDAEGNTTTYEYADLTKAGASKLLSRIQLPKGNYVENEYDSNCRLKSTVSGQNGVPATKTSISVAASYGSDISTKSQVDVERGTETSSYSYTFNGNNVVTEMRGEKGLYINSSYDNNEHPELPTAMQGNSADITSISYDEKGNVTSITLSGNGTQTTTRTYDAMNNLTSYTDPMGNTTRYSYDSKGNRIGMSAPEGVATSTTVDSKGLPTETTNPMGVKTEYDYNDYGNVVKMTLPALGLSSTAIYDAASRLTSATDALGRTSSYVYNNNDFLTSETDAMKHVTAFAYDANDNLTTITNAKGGVTTMSYDNITDRLLSVEFAGARKQYSYNEDGTLNSFTKPDGTTLNYSYDELGRMTSDGINTYSYDDKQRLESVSGNGKTLTFAYDGFNRITGTSCDGHDNSYSYDANDNLTSLNGTQYSYDGLNRLTAVTFSGRSISYTYRKDSQLASVSYPNGLTTEYGYDAVGRLTSKQTKLSNGTVVAGYTFVLDKVGNITEQTMTEPYGDIALANEKASYSYNDGNRITKAGDISFEFDANGNTTKRGSETYNWNSLDRLTKAGSTTLTYDPLGLIASYGDIAFTTDPLGMGNVLSDSRSGATYIYGNGLEARVIDGKASYYVTDCRGSVVAIVDESGIVTHKYQYDEFGKVTQKEEADYNPFQYVGKHGVMALDDHLYYMRARHYDPAIGRFLSEDPIWNTNLYPYAGNNPIMSIDPDGLMTQQQYNQEYDRLKMAISKCQNLMDEAASDKAIYFSKKNGMYKREYDAANERFMRFADMKLDYERQLNKLKSSMDVDISGLGIRHDGVQPVKVDEEYMNLLLGKSQITLNSNQAKEYGFNINSIRNMNKVGDAELAIASFFQTFVLQPTVDVTFKMHNATQNGITATVNGMIYVWNSAKKVWESKRF